MKDETKIWMKYADENLQSAKILIENRLLNPCLQNIQQAVEKSLKTLIAESSAELKKTHSIRELKTMLIKEGKYPDMTEEECDFLDSVYLPSKYPISSALPDFEPDADICRHYISVAERVSNWVKATLQNT
jgi:HEPN domain-containing protein